jgi:hypothetical protein
MPVHDWTRVDAGIFHDFHNAWIIHLREDLNGGLLPSGFYALSEQHLGRYVADVLTLHTAGSGAEPPLPAASGGVLLAEAPPRVRRKFTVSAASRTHRRTLAIRHVSGHRLVAMVEVVSPSNKDRVKHVEEFADKAEDALRQGVHVLLVELFPPGMHDPRGMHDVVWQRFSDESYELPPAEPLTLAAYLADSEPVAYVEHLAAGQVLPSAPLFLTPDRYINLPLESTYQAAFRGLPAFWREVLERA